ncbi:magnesium transporter [Vibrio sp. T187]|uniref:DUF6404 family protein n=1 Tax=Vibrio TaxID=662 RepID=UPI0010C9B196|nr:MULTISPECIES: DUF6404 family protein [Vibrio]MBW3695512.1 magnesium transporter [Vibrio sp. T187]
MNKMDFIQLHLIEKGIPADLTRDNYNLWSRLLCTETKPLVFQSPFTVLIKQGLLFGLVWGALMWLILWHSIPEHWFRYLCTSLVFGMFMGGFVAIRIVKARKKIGNMSWEKWCKTNYEQDS